MNNIFFTGKSSSGSQNIKQKENNDKFNRFLDTNNKRERKRRGSNRLTSPIELMDFKSKGRWSYHKKMVTNWNHTSNNIDIDSMLGGGGLDSSDIISSLDNKCKNKLSEHSRSKLPEHIWKDINLEAEYEKYNKQVIDYKKKEEEYFLNAAELVNLERELDELNKEWKQARDNRNKVINDVYHMREELDRKISENKKAQTMGNVIETEPSNPNIWMTLQSMGCASKHWSISDKKGGSDWDEMIEQYEDKISKLKNDNQIFIENYDIICDECRRQEIQNNDLKNKIAVLEKDIKAALNEKSSWKVIINKYNNGGKK